MMELKDIDLTNKCGSCCHYKAIENSACGECLKNPYDDRVVHDPRHPHWIVQRSRSKCGLYNSKPMTNGDRIRSMTDEELRDFLDKFRVETYTEPFGKKFCKCCPTVGTTEYTECDFVDGVCPHGDSLTWWLEQKVET